MIKIERTSEYGWETAVRGMISYVDPTIKSDSHYCYEPGSKPLGCWGCELNDIKNGCRSEHFNIGRNDLERMKQLVTYGDDYSGFLCFMNVTADVTAPLYWWKELDVYKIETLSEHGSTVFDFTEKEFTISDFSHEHLINDYGIEVKSWHAQWLEHLYTSIEQLNFARKCFLDTNDKKYWHQIVQSLPSNYNQKRIIQLNYKVLRNLYNSRKNRKLNEWYDFYRWMERLRYGCLITQ